VLVVVFLSSPCRCGCRRCAVFVVVDIVIMLRLCSQEDGVNSPNPTGTIGRVGTVHASRPWPASTRSYLVLYLYWNIGWRTTTGSRRPSTRGPTVPCRPYDHYDCLGWRGVLMAGRQTSACGLYHVTFTWYQVYSTWY